MKRVEQNQALRAAVEAARAAGTLMRRHFHSAKRVRSSTQHDIKLELDEQCQRVIERTLRRAFPETAVLGEEGVAGDPAAERRWVVDPIDGTVNFTYGIPHACVSVALQERCSRTEEPGRVPGGKPAFQTQVGVVYDPFTKELFTAVRGQPARLNGRRIQVSRRQRLEECVVAVGFSKTKETLDLMLPTFAGLVHRVRKIRIMGAAALSLAYVGAGRMDAYVETGVRLWDIAAGGLIVECAGGDFWHEAVPGAPHTYRLLVNNGPLRRALQQWADDAAPPPRRAG